MLFVLCSVLHSLEQSQDNTVSVFSAINWPRWFNINFLEPRSPGLLVKNHNGYHNPLLY